MFKLGHYFFILNLTVMFMGLFCFKLVPVNNNKPVKDEPECSDLTLLINGTENKNNITATNDSSQSVQMLKLRKTDRENLTRIGGQLNINDNKSPNKNSEQTKSKPNEIAKATADNQVQSQDKNNTDDEVSSLKKHADEEN